MSVCSKASTRPTTQFLESCRTLCGNASSFHEHLSALCAQRLRWARSYIAQEGPQPLLDTGFVAKPAPVVQEPPRIRFTVAGWLQAKTEQLCVDLLTAFQAVVLSVWSQVKVEVNPKFC